jgi:hypothetical protein
MFRHTPTGQTLTQNISWVDEFGTQHPGNWAIWDQETLTRHGVVEIVEETPPNGAFFTWTQNPDGTLNITPKNLDGVKSAQIALVKTQQGSILAQTDWAYVRLADIGVSVPEAIKTYRDAVRAAAAAMEAEINGATTTDEMAVVLASEGMQWPVDAPVVTTTDEVAVYAVSGPLP